MIEGVHSNYMHSNIMHTHTYMLVHDAAAAAADACIYTWAHDGDEGYMHTCMHT